MDPAAGIAGRTRSRAASPAATSPSGSSSAKNKGPPRVSSRSRAPNRREAVIVHDGDEAGRGVRGDHGEERRGVREAVIVHDLPVASRTRSKLPVADVKLQPPSPFGGNLADAGLPEKGTDDEVEPRGGRGHCRARAPYVGKRIQSMLSSMGKLEASDGEEPPSSSVSGSSANSGGTILGEGKGEAAAFPVKRKRFCGIDVLLPSGGSSASDEPGIAKRTRSHFTPETRARWRRQPGTLRSPYCVDMDSSEPDSDSASSSTDGNRESGRVFDDKDSTDLHGPAGGAEAAEMEGGPKQANPKPWKPCGRWMKGRGRRPLGRAGNIDGLCKVFLDDILKKGGKPGRDMAAPLKDSSPPWNGLSPEACVGLPPPPPSPALAIVGPSKTCVGRCFQVWSAQSCPSAPPALSPRFPPTMAVPLPCY